MTPALRQVRPLLRVAMPVAVTAALVFGIIIGVDIAEKQPAIGGWFVLGVMFGLIFFTGGLLAATEYLAKTICASHASVCWKPTEKRRESFTIWQDNP